MTTRHEVRRAPADPRTELGRAAGMPGTESGARSPVAEAAPGLPERLYAARERKGVDLYRAERDTKIRARYLAALERGDWKELPGAVYTKGFLRNYALYLGLDPEDVLHQWRTERGEIRESEPIVVPRPIQAPRQGLVFSPGVVVAALLTVGVLLFVAYLGAQLLRFAKPPTLEVTAPSVALITVAEDDASYVLRGTSIPGATITVSTPGREQPYRVSADGSGGWAVPVELRRGKNQFDISAVDPETGKQAESPETVYITVPFLVIEAPGLTIDQPADGATFENGAIPVQGSTTNASTVVVSAHYLGPATTQQPATASPPPPTPDPQPLSVAVHEDGSYSTPLELTAGRWELTVTASSQTGKSNSLKRTVTVAYRGVNLTINVRGGPAWLKVWVDGKIAESIGASGRTISAGKTLTFTAQETIEVRTGSSGATLFTLNGTSLGALGPRGVPETWLFAPPSPPEKTQRT